METIRLAFADFWPNFIPEDNYFYHLLSQEFKVVIDDKEPDILFHSVDYAGRADHRKYDDGKTLKIWYTGENQRPDYNQTHLSISFDYSDDPRNYRLPLWVLHLNWFNVFPNNARDQSFLADLEDILDKKLVAGLAERKFCSFVASQPKGRRLEFVPKLSQFKQVDCGGRLFNNVPLVRGRGDEIYKILFLCGYKFNIAMENCSYPGYTTEKIFHAMMANSLPIYWGDPTVGQDFNEGAFINTNGRTDEEVIEEVLRLDGDKDAYLHKLSQPWFVNNQLPSCISPENVRRFIIEGLNKHCT